jgi:hypothetical protein
VVAGNLQMGRDEHSSDAQGEGEPCSGGNTPSGTQADAPEAGKAPEACTEAGRQMDGSPLAAAEAVPLEGPLESPVGPGPHERGREVSRRRRVVLGAMPPHHITGGLCIADETGSVVVRA